MCCGEDEHHEHSQRLNGIVDVDAINISVDFHVRITQCIENGENDTKYDIIE